MKQKQGVESGKWAGATHPSGGCSSPLTTYDLPLPSKGFTLIEMIMVIVITGIIGSMVAVFLKAPVQQYMDVARRADITDIADTALRRITRDLHLALPNSVRVTGACDGVGSCNLEFIPTLGGGRYRAGPPGDELNFSDATDNTFEVLGAGIDVANGDSIVIYNLGIAGADAYGGTSRRLAAAPFGNGLVNITFVPGGTQFPFDSPSHRFHVISRPVTYVCTPVAGGAGGTLTRYWGYAIQAAQPTALATLTSVNPAALLATNVSNCSFTYDPLVSARSGLVTMHLGITEAGANGNETVTLYSAAHVSNQP
ncbi:MAG TPA: prepilin-type N-terminal cleavage/methylation domain-containing protein [Gallionella sp.]|nr:prepilin-type N-terminal cleavage/methylation domain-containing protein [Gallionella sp.]